MTTRKEFTNDTFLTQGGESTEKRGSCNSVSLNHFKMGICLNVNPYILSKADSERMLRRSNWDTILLDLALARAL